MTSWHHEKEAHSSNLINRQSFGNKALHNKGSRSKVMISQLRLLQVLCSICHNCQKKNLKTKNFGKMVEN